MNSVTIISTPASVPISSRSQPKGPESLIAAANEPPKRLGRAADPLLSSPAVSGAASAPLSTGSATELQVGAPAPHGDGDLDDIARIPAPEPTQEWARGGPFFCPDREQDRPTCLDQ